MLSQAVLKQEAETELDKAHEELELVSQLIG